MSFDRISAAAARRLSHTLHEADRDGRSHDPRPWAQKVPQPIPGFWAAITGTDGHGHYGWTSVEAVTESDGTDGIIWFPGSRSAAATDPNCAMEAHANLWVRNNALVYLRVVTAENRFASMPSETYFIFEYNEPLSTAQLYVLPSSATAVPWNTGALGIASEPLGGPPGSDIHSPQSWTVTGGNTVNILRPGTWRVTWDMTLASPTFGSGYGNTSLPTEGGIFWNKPADGTVQQTDQPLSGDGDDGGEGDGDDGGEGDGDDGGEGDGDDGGEGDGDDGGEGDGDDGGEGDGDDAAVPPHSHGYYSIDPVAGEAIFCSVLGIGGGSGSFSDYKNLRYRLNDAVPFGPGAVSNLGRTILLTAPLSFTLSAYNASDTTNSPTGLVSAVQGGTLWLQLVNVWPAAIYNSGGQYT